MENKNIFQSTIQISILVLVIFLLISFFKGSDNLKESKKLIENMMREIKESKEIIQNQAKTIEELQKMNKELSIRVNKVDSTNSVIKKNLDINFQNANRNINEIKSTVANLKTIEFH